MIGKKILFLALLAFLAPFGPASHVGAAEGDITRLTDDTKISTTESVGQSYTRESSAAYLSNGNYAVAWHDYCNVADGCTNDDGSDGTYFQFFGQDGAAIGDPVATGLTAAYGDSVGVVRVTGGFVVSDQTQYRIFDNSGSPLTDVLAYTTSLAGVNVHYAIRTDAGGGFATALLKNVEGTNYPFLETYDLAGTKTGSVQLSATAATWPNFLTLSDNSRYLAIFSISGQIYGQFVGSDLALSGDAFRIDQAASPVLGGHFPFEISQNSAGNILVAWYDARAQQDEGYPDKVYGRLMGSAGAFLTDEFIIASDLIEPSFIGQSGSNLYTWVPPAMTALGERFVVAWNEKDGTNQSSLGVHIKGIVVDGTGSLEGEVFKLETNESTVNPTRRSLFPTLASDGTDNFLLTWFDGRNSYVGDDAYGPGTEIMINFWSMEAAVAAAPADDEDPEDADIDSWKAYLVADRTACPVKLKLEIKGHHFDDDAEVRIGSKEASFVNFKSSRKLTAKFCLPKLLEKYAGVKRNVSVANPGADEEDADKKIDVALVTFPINAGNFDLNTAEGVKNIQRALVRLGYLDARYVTGFYGPITAGAVKKFQADNNLSPTGLFDPQTKAKLQQKVK